MSELRDDDSSKSGPTRRQVLRGALGAAAIPVVAEAAASTHSGDLTTTRGLSSSTLDVTLLVNGRSILLKLDPRTTLLDALRDHVGLTGSKKGCDHGQCGACTVHLGGRRVLSCLTLAAAVQGRPVVTIEGLADGDRLHPMQAAFIAHDAFQCGYCTPGQIMSAVACVAEGHAKSDEEIREYMSGNLCRCAAYPNIVAAVRDAAQTMKG